MKSVWKYILPAKDGVPISIPKGGEVLSVALVDDDVVLYVLVDPSQRREGRKFLSVATGDTVDESKLGKFVGTVVIKNESVGSCVYHVWEQNHLGV